MQPEGEREKTHWSSLELGVPQLPFPSEAWQALPGAGSSGHWRVHVQRKYSGRELELDGRGTFWSDFATQRDRLSFLGEKSGPHSGRPWEWRREKEHFSFSQFSARHAGLGMESGEGPHNHQVTGRSEHT